MPETQATTTATTPVAAPPAVVTPPPAAAPAAKKGAAKAAAAKPAPAAPKAPDGPAAAKAGQTAVQATVPAEFKPEVTVQVQKAAAEAAATEKKAAEEAAAGRTKSKSLEQVRAERRARVEAAGTGAAATTDAATAEGAAAAEPADAAKVEADKKAAEEKATSEAEKVAAAAKKPETVDVDIPPEKLKEFTKLNRDLATARAKVRELESTAAPDAAKIAEARELAAAGRHFEAIKAVGLDFDAASMEVLQLAAEDKDTDPKIKALADELKETREKLAKLEEGQTKTVDQINAEAQRAEKAARAAGEERIVAEVTMASEHFPFLSKEPAFVREALEPLNDDVDPKTGKVTAEGAYSLAKKHYGRELTDTEKNNLLRAALEEAEDKHAARARLYGVVPKKPKEKPAEAPAAAPTETPAAAASATPTTADASMRGSVGIIRPRGKLTLAEIKAQRRKEAGR